MIKKADKIKIMAVMVVLIVFLGSCSKREQSVENNTGPLSVGNSVFQDDKMSEDLEENTIIEVITTKSTDEVTTTERLTETTTLESSIEETAQQATTTQQETTTHEKTTEKKIEQSMTNGQTTPQSTTATNNDDDDYVYEDGIMWAYWSDLYDDNTEKGKLEDIFWQEFGWTLLGKDKCDKMVQAMVELVYDIMQKSKTEFEREHALFEAICTACNYDYDAYYNGTSDFIEGSPYGVLVEGEAVCGGYAITFNIACDMMGIECNYITGWSKQNGGRHAWNQVCIDGDWYEVDCTWCDGNDGWDYYYFNITTEEMSLTHSTTDKFECTGTKHNEAYLENMYKAEFLADKLYIEKVDECMNYIAEQAEKGMMI